MGCGLPVDNPVTKECEQLAYSIMEQSFENFQVRDFLLSLEILLVDEILSNQCNLILSNIPEQIFGKLDAEHSVVSFPSQGGVHSSDKVSEPVPFQHALSSAPFSAFVGDFQAMVA
mmetsp:Transcript_20985/g.20106  ORF Transcript_20985/g.20106 Transcript_20985/m.20106 type:complete len:116 (-) Transcript_20985:1085-1432(-)